jgi:hypothetical protein
MWSFLQPIHILRLLCKRTSTPYRHREIKEIEMNLTAYILAVAATFSFYLTARLFVEPHIVFAPIALVTRGVLYLVFARQFNKS